MMNVFSLILIFAVCCASLPSASFAASIHSAEEQAQKMLRDNDSESTLLLVEQSLNSGHESPELYMIQAEAFYLLGEINESLQSLAAYEILWNMRNEPPDALP